MRWFCLVSVVGFTLGCGFGEAQEGDGAHADGADGAAWGKIRGINDPSSKDDDGWDVDNPVRGLRFKGEFEHAGKTVQPKFCVAGTDPGTNLRMIALIYARLNAPEEGGWLVAHSLDGTFPDTNSDTLVLDMSNPNKPPETEMGAKGCGSSKVRDGGSVTDIDRWDGSLELDCPGIGAKGTVQFEGCAVFDVESGMSSASTGSLGSLQSAFGKALRKR